MTAPVATAPLTVPPYATMLGFTRYVSRTGPAKAAFVGGLGTGGTLMGMADGSVRGFRYGIGYRVMIPVLTLIGGEIYTAD